VDDDCVLYQQVHAITTIEDLTATGHRKRLLTFKRQAAVEKLIGQASFIG
jgi:hypothetical protein